eukprot:5435-Rhodomonas_salina.1
MAGTDVAYGASRRIGYGWMRREGRRERRERRYRGRESRESQVRPAIVLRARCAMSGTNIAYAATCLLCDVQY